MIRVSVVVTGVSVHAPNRGIVRTDIWSEGQSMIPDDPDTLTR